MYGQNRIDEEDSLQIDHLTFKELVCGLICLHLFTFDEHEKNKFQDFCFDSGIVFVFIMCKNS